MNSQEQRERLSARDMLDAIPLARRNLFDAVREGRRLQYHGLERHPIRTSRRAIDPDDVDRRALVALLAEAEGQETEDGWGLVPEGTLEALEWYKLDVSALLDAPDEALYALNRSSAADKRKQLRLLIAHVRRCAGSAGAVDAVAKNRIWPDRREFVGNHHRWQQRSPDVGTTNAGGASGRSASDHPPYFKDCYGAWPPAARMRPTRSAIGGHRLPIRSQSACQQQRFRQQRRSILPQA